jgi:acyl-coenzyme A synthetase/AMP-(fatty) acid ligase
MSIFFKDISKHQEISWDRLLDDLNNTRTFNPYYKSDDYYEVFKNIIVSMLLNKEIVLLDSDFTGNELLTLTGQSSFDNYSLPVDTKLTGLGNKNLLIEKLINTKDGWQVTIFTSGTTGIPKKVTHSFNSLTRFVKRSESQQNCIWGFAFNPTHIAGLQVYLQALLNGNSIIRLFGLSKEEIHQEINARQITNISATPTFYKLLFPCKEKFLSVKRLTSGGEKFNTQLAAQLKELFPAAKITNVYASTEAGTLFASENDVFVVKNEFAGLIKEEDGELLIHSSLMGYSMDMDTEWYHTNDLIELIEKYPLKFRFLSRKSEMINVGGYKVNPSEVEEVVHSIPGVKEVKVYAKSNSVLGNIVCCDIVSATKLEETAIRLYLQTKLQEYKIPRIIKFVNALETTRTGKLKRN